MCPFFSIINSWAPCERKREEGSPHWQKQVPVLETIFTTTSKLHALYSSCLVYNVTNPNSNEYKLTAIVLDIADNRPLKHVSIKKVEIDKRSFLKLSFANKALDGINLGNILHKKSVKSKISKKKKKKSNTI